MCSSAAPPEGWDGVFFGRGGRMVVSTPCCLFGWKGATVALFFFCFFLSGVGGVSSSSSSTRIILTGEAFLYPEERKLQIIRKKFERDREVI
jgi:hypothetical protein